MAEWLNGGQFTNQGVELSLSARPLQLRNSLGWSTTLSFYRNYSVVNSLPVRGFQIPHSGGGGVGASWEQPGRSVSEIVNTGQVGVDGVPMQVGDGQPSFIMSFNNDLTFAQFRLSGLLDWSRGGNVQDISATDYDFGPGLWGDSARSAERAAAFVAGFAPYVEPATFVKLRQIVVSYTVASRWVNAIGGGRIASARLSLAGRNLLGWYSHGYEGLDPETSAFGSRNVGRGIEITPYPPSRSYFLSLDQ